MRSLVFRSMFREMRTLSGQYTYILNGWILQDAFLCSRTVLLDCELTAQGRAAHRGGHRDDKETDAFALDPGAFRPVLRRTGTGQEIPLTLEDSHRQGPEEQPQPGRRGLQSRAGRRHPRPGQGGSSCPAWTSITTEKAPRAPPIGSSRARGRAPKMTTIGASVVQQVPLGRQPVPVAPEL